MCQVAPRFLESQVQMSRSLGNTISTFGNSEARGTTSAKRTGDENYRRV